MQPKYWSPQQMFSKGSRITSSGLSYRKPEVINSDDISSGTQGCCKHYSKDLLCQSWQGFLQHEWKWQECSACIPGSGNYTGAVYLARGDPHLSYRSWPLQTVQVVSLQNNSYFGGIQEIQDWLSARFQSISKPWSHLRTVFTGDSNMYEWLLYLGMTRWALLIA